MNDFTKEELKELMYGLYCMSKLDRNMVNPNLYEKIESIIDNYCEHESDGKDYYPGLYDKVCSSDEIRAIDLNRVKKCIKCYRYFE